MATVGVRPHGFTAAALLAVAALLGLAHTLGLRAIPRETPLLALYGALTLLAQAVAYWYLPSFAKREVVLPAVARVAGPALFPLAVVASAVGLDLVRAVAVALALATFAALLAASARFGPTWRSGVPFWREGPHARGDRLALATFAASCAMLAAAAVLALLGAARGLATTWTLGLGLFALAALAHLLPRLRGRDAVWPLYAGSVGVGLLGGALVTLRRIGVDLVPSTLAYPLLLAFPVAAFALVPPGAKRAGPRMRDAGPLLGAAWLAATIGALLLLPRDLEPTRFAIASQAVALAVALAVGAVALLALPVVFNAVPDHRFVGPCAVAALLGLAMLAGETYAGLSPWRGAALLGGSLACFLGAVAPLRAPRRDCPV